MFYIFNKNNECIAAASGLPDIDDLKTRDEICIESDIDVPSIDFLKNNNGKIEICPVEEKKQVQTFEEKLEEIRNKIIKYREDTEAKDITYKDNLYQVDSVSLNRLSLSLNLNNETIDWKTSNNSIETLTKEDINNIIKLVAERNLDIFLHVSNIKEKLNLIKGKRSSGSISEEEAINMLIELKNTLYM